MKKTILALVMLLAAATMASADASMKFTINNKTSRTVSVAVTWDPGASVITKGWWSVEAGKSRTVTIKDFYGVSEFGFYAKNSPKEGEKQKIWGSDGSSSLYGKLPIHQTNAFENVLAQGGDDNRIEPGSKEVGFRKLHFKHDKNWNATCTVTLNP